MKRIVCSIIAIILFLLPAGCTNIAYNDYSTRIFSNAIGFDVALIGKNSDQAYQKMLDTLEELNEQININQENAHPMNDNSPSDILRLNRANANEEIAIGFYAYYLLTQAKEMFKLTQGAFNVAAYPMSFLWGVDPISLDHYYQTDDELTAPVPPSFVNSPLRSKFKPSALEIEQIKAFCDLDMLNVYSKNGLYYAKKQIKELMVDLGAIAKGYAADLCAQICAEYEITSAFINISGNLYMFGSCYDDKWLNSWPIKLRNPLNEGILCVLDVNDYSSTVTSGGYERFRYFVNDKTQIDINEIRTACHIIDPIRGIPYSLNAIENDYFNTQNHITSATVISSSSMIADCLTTAICVMGINKAPQLINDYNAQKENNEKVSAIMFTADKKMININVSLADTDKFNAYKQYIDISEG